MNTYTKAYTTPSGLHTYSSEADNSIVALIDAYITAYSEPDCHSIYYKGEPIKNALRESIVDENDGPGGAS